MRMRPILVVVFLTVSIIAFAQDFGGYRGVKKGGTFTGNVTFTPDAGIVFGDGTTMNTVASGPVKATTGSDLSGSRLAGTVYQNTTGKLMWVQVGYVASGSAPWWFTEHAWVEGVNPPTRRVEYFTQGDQTAAASVTFFVPTNHFYKITIDHGGNAPTMDYWYESTIDGGGTGSESKMVEVINGVADTGARLYGTTYQNGPNWRFINVTDCTATSGADLVLFAGPASPVPSYPMSVHKGTSADAWGNISSWVPPSYYYKVTLSGAGTCDAVNHRWVEQDLTVVGSSPAYVYASGSAQTFAANSWTAVSFGATHVAKGVTVSGTSITFSRKGVYRIALGMRHKGNDVWTAVRIHDGTSVVSASNGFGSGSGAGTDSVEQTPEMLADITNTALTYQVQIGRNAASGSTIDSDLPTYSDGGYAKSITLTIQSVDSSTDGTAGNIVAWAHFTTGSAPVKAAGSSNVSITRTAAGQYTLTFSPALADTNYSLTALCKGVAATWGCGTQESHDATRTSSTYYIYTFKDDDSVSGMGSLEDFTNLDIQVVR